MVFPTFLLGRLGVSPDTPPLFSSFSKMTMAMMMMMILLLSRLEMRWRTQTKERQRPAFYTCDDKKQHNASPSECKRHDV